MSKIAKALQKERTTILDGKEIVPNKVDIHISERCAYGSILEATRIHAQRMPHLLFDYHKDLKNKYKNRVMCDDSLDKLVYSLPTTQIIA